MRDQSYQRIILGNKPELAALNYRLFAKFAEGDLEIMKYDIGSIVVLTSGRTVYITNYNENSKKYSGFDVNDTDGKAEVRFSETSVLMKI